MVISHVWKSNYLLLAIPLNAFILQLFESTESPVSAELHCNRACAHQLSHLEVYHISDLPGVRPSSVIHEDGPDSHVIKRLVEKTKHAKDMPSAHCHSRQTKTYGKPCLTMAKYRISPMFNEKITKFKYKYRKPKEIWIQIHPNYCIECTYTKTAFL